MALKEQQTDAPDAPVVDAVAPAPELTPVDFAAEAVAATKSELDEAVKAHAESETAQAVADAQAQHDVALATHAELVKEPTPELGKHILVDAGATGTYALRDLPGAFAGTYPRHLIVDGVNVEHVDDHETGVWMYRRM